jgi:hypothetical protein
MYNLLFYNYKDMDCYVRINVNMSEEFAYKLAQEKLHVIKLNAELPSKEGSCKKETKFIDISDSDDESTPVKQSVDYLKSLPEQLVKSPAPSSPAVEFAVPEKQ